MFIHNANVNGTVRGLSFVVATEVSGAVGGPDLIVEPIQIGITNFDAQITLDVLNGVRFSVRQGAIGDNPVFTANEVRGFYVEGMQHSSPEFEQFVIGDFYGLKIDDMWGDGSDVGPDDSMVNSYGVFIADQSGANNTWSIKTGTAKNEFGGDMFFSGASSGLPFGAFYGNNIGWTSTAFGGGGTFVIINTLTTGAALNLTTFQNTQELLINKTGKYLVTWALSGEIAGANKHIEAAPGVNGTANVAGRNHVETGHANEEYAMSGTAILSLNATNTLSLMITNTDNNTQITVHHVNLTAVQIGG
jgi:hypothetical protein